MKHACTTLPPLLELTTAADWAVVQDSEAFYASCNATKITFTRTSGAGGNPQGV